MPDFMPRSKLSGRSKILVKSLQNREISLAQALSYFRESLPLGKYTGLGTEEVSAPPVRPFTAPLSTVSA